MDQADDSQHFESEQPSQEQSPSLLTIILDTNPAAWALLQDTLSLSSAVANLLIFINAHLACNYTNQVAVIASHCDKAQWLYPTAATQSPSHPHSSARRSRNAEGENDDGDGSRRARLNGTVGGGGDGGPENGGAAATHTTGSSNKYRPFRLIEEELIRNLTNLIDSTTPETVQSKTSTMIAGALSLALSYINRASTEYSESMSGAAVNLAEQSATQVSTDPEAAAGAGGGGGSGNSASNTLQARILLVTLSPSTDLAHQYIPIMNSIFACQRLGIPIDVLQLPLPSALSSSSSHVTTTSTTAAAAATTSNTSVTPNQNSTVFLQQAADATHGIYIPAQLSAASSSSSPSRQQRQRTASTALLTYLLPHLLPSSSLRPHLILPTRIDVDFRAACFCHRNVISIGYVCSICLSIFCQESADLLERGECLTCGSRLEMRTSEWGMKPIVIAPATGKKKKRKSQRDGEVAGKE